MKRTSIYMAFIIGAGLLFSSCLKEEWGVGNIHHDEQQKTEGWNKHRTFKMLYISQLDDNLYADAEGAAAYLNREAQDVPLCVVDRTDVLVSDQSFNPATEIAFRTARFSSYALNKMTHTPVGVHLEGATILFNHKINNEQSLQITPDCYAKFIPVQVTTMAQEPLKIVLPFSTLRFSSKEQIAAAGQTLSTLMGRNYNAVLVGTVKTSLLKELEQAVASLKESKLTVVTPAAETAYTLFMLADASWVLRETEKASVSGEVQSYSLSIEAGVE